MNSNKRKSLITYVLMVVAILIITNIIARNKFFRLDLTDNKMYTISESSKSVVRKIDDRLTMKIYFSDNLPGEYGNNRRYLQDILEEYAAYAKGNIYFEFYPTDDDEKMQEDAQKSGVQPVQLQVIENDALEVKKVYMGMVFLYEDKRESIPVIQTTTGLEYEITTKIKKLVESEKQTIAIAKKLNQETVKTENITQILSERYNVLNINLDQSISNNVNLVIMSGVDDSLNINEKQNLEDYLNKGGNLLLTQNRVKTDLNTQQANQITSNIFSLLESYGITILPNLVLDKNCGKVNVQQNLGFLRIPVPMDYPFLPIIKKQNFNNDISIVNNLEALRLMFPSEIAIDNNNENLSIIPLFNSSNKSATMEEFFQLSPDPQQNPVLNQLNGPSKLLGALIEKSFPDFEKTGQIIIVSDSKFITDDGGGASPENQIFIMNAADYLLGDKELIALRSNQVTSRPLKDIEDTSKSRWKWINLLLPSILIISFGFIRLRSEGNRSKVLEQIYD